MRTRRPSPWAAGLCAAVFMLLAQPGRAQEVLPGKLLPLAVRDGSCEFVLPTSQAGDKFYLILGSLARGPGPYRVTVRTESTTRAPALPVEDTSPADGWRRHVAELRDRLVKARVSRPAAEPFRPVATPPAQRSFDLFVKERDFENPANYARVSGVLQAVGRHCQVYVDRDCPDAAGLRPTVAETVRAFDEEVYPLARARLGEVLDVDRDGRFTILFTAWLGKLSGGKVALGGFVRGSDWYRDLAAPYGNRCDMMYLNTDLRPGPHLRSLLAHEYTHAVVFSEHVFGGYLPELPGQDEESWLNEALAHLAEDLHGYGWSNLDYRISAFLSAPERYQLVVPDYYGAGLWRSPGHRGAAYLFLRWCADGQGTDLPTRLIQTSLAGVANLEAATQQPFAELFRRWSVALLWSGTSLPGEPAPPLRRLNPRRPLGDRLLCGPRFAEVPLAGGRQEVSLAGTSAAYLLLHSPECGAARVTVKAGSGCELQVSLIRLPARTARLSLRCRPTEQPGTVRLILTAQDADVTLDAVAWERLMPVGNLPGDTSKGSGIPRARAVLAGFGEVRLKAGETWPSAPVAVPAAAECDGPLVFKVAATDKAGHRLAAWAVAARSD